MKIPCKECPTLAICKHRKELRCFKLYNHIMESGGFSPELKELMDVGTVTKGDSDEPTLRKLFVHPSL